MNGRDLFKNFDFQLLDDPDFREASVREVLVTPLLTALGYSESPPHRIIRGRRLQHPYVYIGTGKKSISIIPDYLLQRDGESAWILDAKSPDERIDSGKNVEQAYSYAIHRDVNVPVYALCNGRRITVFHVSRWPALIDLSLQELPKNWLAVLDLLGTRTAWPYGLPPGFLPDLGLALRKSGLHRDEDGQKTFQVFLSVQPSLITRIEDKVYSLSAPYAGEYETGNYGALMLTFDFDDAVYENLLIALPENLREEVRGRLCRQPYRVHIEGPGAPLLMVIAEPGDTIHTNEDESYCPFIAQEFRPMPGTCSF